MTGAAAALYGPAHGGANEAVLNMLNEIGSVDKVPAYIERVENKEVVLQGFGHRVYKNYDPRAAIVKETAYSVFEVTGKNPLIDIALELERIALQEEYFISRAIVSQCGFLFGYYLSGDWIAHADDDGVIRGGTVLWLAGAVERDAGR